MTSAPKSVTSLKRYAAQHPEFKEFTKILNDAIGDPSDRAAVVTVVALLEGALKVYLATKFIMHEQEGQNDLFGPGGPIRDFSAKIKAGFALGLFGPLTREDLHIIREVRNSFAHSMVPISFENDDVKNVCSRIGLLTRFQNLPAQAKIELNELSIRSRFLTAAAFIAIEFAAAPSYPEGLSKGIRDAIVL